MSCFKLPISLCNQIQSSLIRFWWDDKLGVRKISWVLPLSAGGLGFREIREFNEALLAKLSWRLVVEPDSLVAKLLKGKYYPSSIFMDCPPTSNGSHGWTGLLAGREVIKLGLGWIVGNGRNIKVWGDAWLSTSTPTQPYGPPPFDAINLKVSDLIHSESNTWDIQAIRRYLPHYADLITRLVLSTFSMEDSRSWLPVKSGIYSTNSGYALRKLNVVPIVEDEFDWKTCVWKVRTAPKLRNFLRKLKSRALAVGSNLATHVEWWMALDVSIVVMRKMNYISFLLCPFAASVWDIAPVLFKPSPSVNSVNQLLATVQRQINLPPVGLTEAPLFPWLLWGLWRAKKCTSARELVLGARALQTQEQDRENGKIWRKTMAENM